ncbi:MAG: CsiV family protein, partial [Gammaproteobacteria bacterium]
MTDLVTARVTRRLLAAVMLLCAAGVSAQQPEALPRFQIELVVFENLAQPATAEAPPFEWLEPPVVQTPGIPDTLDAPNPAGTPTEPEPSTPIFFSLSPSLSMENIAASLQRRSEYRVLLHEAWVQDGFEGEAARPVDVGLLEQLQPVTRSSRRARSSSGEPLTGT